MDPALPAPRRRGRLWLRGVLFLAALGLLAVAWVLFLPVPLGWIARPILARSQPPGTAPKVELGSATFRWHFGQPALSLDMRGVSATVGTQPLASVPVVVVKVAKTGLFSGRVVATEVVVTNPALTLDETGTGALATLSAPAPGAAPAPATPAPIDLTQFDAYLPASGQSTHVTVQGLSARLRRRSGEVELHFAPITASLARNAAGELQLESVVPLSAAAQPPRVDLRATVVPATGRVRFTAAMPAFAVADLPAVPGMPDPIPLRAQVAVDVSGHASLKTLALEDVVGGIVLRDATLVIPGSTLPPIPITAAELRGRADLKAGTASLETGRVEMPGMRASISQLEASLGAQPRIRWRAELSGLGATTVLPFLPPSVRAQLPMPETALADLTVARAETSGDLLLSQSGTTFTAQSVQTTGSVNLTLGSVPLTLAWSGRQASPADPVEFRATIDRFNPRQWASLLPAGTPAQAVDIGVGVTVDAQVSPAGVPLKVALGVTSGAGTLHPLQPNLPAVAVRRLELRVESDQPERAWRVPVARIELADNASVEIVGAQVDIAATALAARGEARAAGVTGAFLATWLSADAWKPLTDLGVTPADVSLARADVRYDAQARLVGTSWNPHAANVTSSMDVRIHGTPLSIATRAVLSEGGNQIDATMELSEFRPAGLRLKLAEDITSAAFDFPVTFRATARAGLDGTLTTAAMQVRAGAGRIRLPAPYSADIPLRAMNLDAAYDPAGPRARIENLMVDTGVVRWTLSDAVVGLTAPYDLSGQVDVAAFSIPAALALWPASQEPELRKMVVDALKAGDVTSFKAVASARYNPAAPAGVDPLRIVRLQGEAGLARIEAAGPDVPGPVSIGALAATFDYPKAQVQVRDTAVPGARIASALVDLTGLDTAAPQAAITGRFESDLVAANRAWQFAPEGFVTGRATGDFTVRAPLSVESAQVDATLDTSAVRMLVNGVGNAVPASIRAQAKVTQLAGPAPKPAVEFIVDTPEWLGAPLHVSGSTQLDADYQPTVVNLARYEHGRSRLQGRINLAAGFPTAVDLSGARLDVGPLMRTGLAVADALAPAPVVAPPPPPPVPPGRGTAAANAGRGTPPAGSGRGATAAARGGAAPAPTVAARAPAPPAPAAVPPSPPLDLDIRVDEIEFGAGQTARDFKLVGRLENDFPVALALGATANNGNAMSVDLDGPRDRQRFRVAIDDTAGWVRTFTAPWSAASPGTGAFGTLVTQFVKIPAIVSGGRVAVEAELTSTQSVWLTGNVRLSRATMVRPPRILQMLALKSGKSVQNAPLIEEFSIAKFSVGATEVRVDTIGLTGSGLINNLKVKSATYALANEAIKVDGEYFGVGFEVIGTRAAPQIFLKDDNTLLRAIGTRNEFDFGPAPAAPAPGTR